MSNYKRILTALSIILLLGALLYSPIGRNIRLNLAKTVIETRFQPYAWILVGKTQKRENHRILWVSSAPTGNSLRSFSVVRSNWKKIEMILQIRLYEE
jgi:hypothetical protein